MVARPSPTKARPMYGSILRPVIPATAFRCPRFSATRITATGAINIIAWPLKDGGVKCGSPNHAAWARGEKSSGLPRPKPLASRAYSAQATIRPTRISRRCSIPRVNTATMPIQSTVNTAIQLSKALADTLRTAIGARFRPIAITTAPVTTGGIRRSIQRVPIFITTRPIRV